MAATGGATPCMKLEIYWDSGWVDESSSLVGASGEVQLLPPAEGLVATGLGAGAQAYVTVDNRTGRYSRYKAGSQANTYGIYGKSVRLSGGYVYQGTPEYVVVFTGRIVDVREDETSGRATLTCHDMASAYEQAKASTVLHENVRTDLWISEMCSALGITNYDLDRGLAVIPFAWLDDDYPLAEARAAAIAEGGVVFFDSDGQLRFWNATHWCNATSVATFTTDDYAELEPVTDYVNVVNIVGVEYQPRQVVQPTVVYQLQRPLGLPPGESRLVTLKFQLPLETFQGYVLHATSGGEDVSSDVSVSPAAPQYASSWYATFSNSDTRRGVWVTTFEVYGRPVAGRPAEQYVYDASDGNIPRRRDFRGHIDIQTEAQATLLAALLAERLKEPRLRLALKGLYANPLLELGDVVTVQGDLTGVDKNALLTHISWQFGGGAYTMDIEVADYTDFYKYNNYFKVGTSKLGSSGEGIGRLFI